MRFQRLIVVGAGAVGGAIGGLVAQSGFSVELVSRGPHGQRIRDEGLLIRLPDRNIKVHIPCYEDVQQIAWRPGDVALLATKLGDARSVMDQLAAAAGSELPVVCAMNGMHSERWAVKRFRSVLSMLVWIPATHLCPGEVSVYSDHPPAVLDTGPVHIDCDSEMELATEFCERLRLAGFDACPRSDIRRWKFAKWITNLGGTAQALVKDDWKVVAALARAEGESVLDKAGVNRVATQELLDRCEVVQMQSIDGKDRLGGSTWQSRHRGKPLETPWLEGTMARLGKKLNVPTPINRKLAELAAEARPVAAAEVLSAG